MLAIAERAGRLKERLRIGDILDRIRSRRAEDEWRALQRLHQTERHELARSRGLLGLGMNARCLRAAAKRFGIDVDELTFRHRTDVDGRSHPGANEHPDFAGAIGNAAHALDGLDVLDSRLRPRSRRALRRVPDPWRSVRESSRGENRGPSRAR